MKKIALLALLMANLFASDIAWNDTYAQAQAKAKKESKPMLVIITTEQCRWCRKLEATTLSDDEVVSKINSRFVPVHLTRDKSVYPKNLTAKMVPMSYFLDGNGKILYSMPGYWPVEDYQSILDDALRKVKK
ncbi:MAG: thioredoxin family protein [Sulfuricurvum sp.]|uniref:thioredoxin family protein n=1 Tax=Sulfuricurvum sp. TaxID=2025608 RepID=UPI002732B8AE|nr:thioredoxin family protein [Sulfuricurvum sp.]MDP3291967.1 thioredoxin family protein [Sulfuricurvum sp.]